MSRPDYGPLARLLHRLALGSRVVGQASFDLEEMTSGRSPDLDIIRPVFICGLARSGSTILLNALYQTGQFRSLTYRDMPFVLMSGLWKKLSASSRMQREERERAHGDRIMVDYDSPEAFEEVFWRTYYGEHYVKAARVVPHQAPKSVRQKFQRFVQHVLKSRDYVTQTRYLSKNNNNLLRIPTLKRAFPDAVIIVPFREPLQQAQSLLKQHQLFSQMHETDQFSLDYMNWLGHFEFGLGHKHYSYMDGDNALQPANLDYWLQSWHDAYTFALDTAPPDAMFLGYEQLCNSPLEVFSTLLPSMALEGDAAKTAAFYKPAGQHDEAAQSSELMEACRLLHAKLLARHDKCCSLESGAA